MFTHGATAQSHSLLGILLIKRISRKLFKWHEHEHEIDKRDLSIAFSALSLASQPNDFFTREQRRQLRDVALEYGSIVGYN